MDIQIKNPGMPPFKVERPTKKNGIKWSYKVPKLVDKFQSREGDMTLPREVPVKQFAIVTFTDGGKVVFRGYVEQYEIDNKRTKTLTLQGMEKQLEYRYMPDYYYPLGTTFAKLFTHACNINDPPGLLAIANGMMAIGRKWEYENEANNVIKLLNCGTLSKYGTKDLYFLDYKYVRELVSVHDIGELAYIDFTYFRDKYSLWIRIDHDYSRGWADRGGVICDGCNDTTIRLGDCPAAAALLGDLRTVSLEDNIADTIFDLLKAHGYYMHWRDAAKYTYLDISTSEGRS